MDIDIDIDSEVEVEVVVAVAIAIDPDGHKSVVVNNVRRCICHVELKIIALKRDKIAHKHLSFVLVVSNESDVFAHKRMTCKMCIDPVEFDAKPAGLDLVARVA